MNIWEITILFFSFQAILLGCLFLFIKKGDRTANRIFAVFLFLFGYNIFYNVLAWSRFDLELLVNLGYTYPIPLSLFGGIFFLYVRRVVTGQQMQWKDFIHTLPLFLVLFIFGSFYILPTKEKMDILTGVTTNTYTSYLLWISPWMVLTMLGYGIYTFIKFTRKYKNDLEIVIWLKAISLVFMGFIFSHILYRTLVFFTLIKIEFDYFITLFMIAFVGLVCYFAFVYNAIFDGTPINTLIPFVKYGKTGLSQEFSEEMKEKLLGIMKTEKPYLDSNLRLDMIAEMLDISRHHASQIINEHFSVNFYDFINQYRLKEAKKLLQSKLSITDVAYQSGFNNRVSFYNAFKKLFGITPSEYRSQSIAS